MNRVIQKGCCSISIMVLVLFAGQLSFPVKAAAESPHRWTVTLNNPAENGTDEGHGIAFDGNGSVVVAGRTYSSEEGFNIWLAKFSPRGDLLWSAVYNSPWNDIDEGRDVALGPDGSIYVVGRTWIPGSNFDLWLGKFTPGGELVWERTYAGSAGEKDEGRGVDVGPDGSIYVTGGVTSNGFSTDLWVGKFDSDGALLWENSFDGGGGKDTGYGMAAAPSGTVYGTGTLAAPDGELDIWLAGFSGFGVLDWERRAPRTGQGFRDGRSVALGADGSILVAGSVPSPAGGSLVWLGSFSPSGELLWEATAGEGSAENRARDVAAGHNGKIYVVGNVSSPLEDRNIWIGRFGRHGKLEKEIVLDGGAGLSDEAMAVAVSRPNDIAIAGYTSVAGEGENIWVWKSRGTTVKEIPDSLFESGAFNPLLPVPSGE